MTSYYKITLGAGSAFLDECLEGGFIGADFDIREDLTTHLTDDWREFNKRYVPVYMSISPRKTKEAAETACGMLWTVCRGIEEGDVVLTPAGAETLRVGVVSGPYSYVPDTDYFAPDTDYVSPDTGLRHRRSVQWRSDFVSRTDMSDALRRAMATMGSVANVTQFADELETILGRGDDPASTVVEPSNQKYATFTLEKYLEDFLVANWTNTELGKTHRIYEVDGMQVGQQYATDTGSIDILAISHDGSELLVVELAKGRASDAVVGQVLRYMGYLAQEVAEEGQSVRGAIVALEDDLSVRRALAVAPGIDFYRYDISFRLRKG